AVLIDEEVKKIVMDANDKAKQLLKDNQDTLIALAKALLEKETIDQNDINNVLQETGCKIPEENRRRLDKALNGGKNR
ncbi:MAG: hypothetical protein LC633_09360, partial [Desulfobulbaceae bacterium]|nr:hypothetical protein [Desulfobulbaceae bacterium]